MYDHGDRVTYLFPAQDIGAATVTLKVNGPKGKTGVLRDYGIVNVTEAFTADTTAATIAVGKTGNTDAYGEELSMGTTAAGGGKTVRSTYNKATDLDDYIVATIPADTEVFVTCTAPTGGVPAGIGAVLVVVDWAW